MVGHVLRLYLFLDIFCTFGDIGRLCYTLGVIGRLCSVIVTIPGHFYTLGVIGRLCSVIATIPGHILYSLWHW